MNAELDKILWLFDNYTVYSISKGTGISFTTLNPYKLGQRKFENMTLAHASKLTAYAEMLMNEPR